ncbi:serine protease [Mesorhizobium sp. M0751]|uniref:S1 family peptidase n=1 Tax=unclassified Mesorhizobium TaxID=325217 RepID=UPI00333662B6
MAEQLLYSTVKLTSSSNGVPSSTGTGFFMSFPFDGGRNVIVLITNKHVLNGATAVTAVCHVAEGDTPSGRFLPCTIANRPEFVVHHPAADVDLCALIFGPILNQAYEAGTSLFFRSIDPSLIPEPQDWEFFDAIEDVTMIGCPRGISDEVNNLPIVRRGITASALSKKYNGKEEFMVDMACFPGSSGSPIFLYDRNGYFDRKQNSYMLGASRLKLVGILYSGPLVTNDGRLVLAQIPRVAVNSMMHLGNALRSTAILQIESEIRRRLVA